MSAAGQPVGDQDEHENRDRERQHKRCDSHADGALDLVAHLDGDRFPEQLDAAGDSSRCDLGPKVERQREDDDRGDRGRQDRVGVDGQPQPLMFGVFADLDLGGRQDRLIHRHCSLPIR
jgi:hypothetical protein